MGIISTEYSNNSDHFLLLFLWPLDHRYQIRFTVCSLSPLSLLSTVAIHLVQWYACAVVLYACAVVLYACAVVLYACAVVLYACAVVLYMWL